MLNKLTENATNVESDFKYLLEEFMYSGCHEYKTLQNGVCYYIVERIYKRVKQGHGHKFGAIKIDVKENLIIDGNHRYIAYKLAGFEFDIQPYCKNFSDKPPYKEIGDIRIDDQTDWDYNDPSKRKYCNDDFLHSYKEN